MKLLSTKYKLNHKGRVITIRIDRKARDYIFLLLKILKSEGYGRGIETFFNLLLKHLEELPSSSLFDIEINFVVASKEGTTGQVEENFTGISPVYIFINNIYRSYLMRIFLFGRKQSQHRLMELFEECVIGTIIHEIAHLITYKQNHFLKLRNELLSKAHRLELESQIRPSMRPSFRKRHYRRLYTIIKLCYYEGIAEFCKYSFTRRILPNEDQIREVYLITKERFSNLFARLSEGGSYRVLYDSKLKDSYYDIGYHMVCVIIVIQGVTLEKIFSLKPSQFVELYEDGMKKLNLEPIISWKSNKGIFDLKRSIGKTWRYGLL